MIEKLIVGAVGGFAYSLSGLVKKDNREGFDIKKMIPTIIVGGVIGGIAGYFEMDYAIAAQLPMVAGVTAVIENAWKAFYRKVIC